MQFLDLINLDRDEHSLNSSGQRVLDHYSFFWAGSGFEPVSLSAREIALRRERVLRQVAATEARLHEVGFPTERLRAALILGNGTANGHAFVDTEGPIAWFAIECFRSEFEAKVFVMHELVHALHYGMSPEFAFDTIQQKNLVSRQLVTEGIATYLTKRLWNLNDEQALWADVLPEKQIRSWMTACRNSEREVFEWIARHFDSSDPRIELFYATNPNDIFSFRAGYYAALKIIEAIANEKGFSDMELLRIPRAPLKLLAWNALQEFA